MAQWHIRHLNLTNGSSTNGGLIFVQPALVGGRALVLEDVNLDSSEATSVGGAVYVGENNILDITDSEFTNNFATQTGGAIYVESSDTPITIENSTFIGNNSEISAGAIYAENADINISNSTFGGVAEADGNYSDGLAGAIYMVGGILNMIDVTFQNNHSLLQGGAIKMESIPGFGLVNLIQQGGAYINNYSGDPDLIEEGVLAEQFI